MPSGTESAEGHLAELLGPHPQAQLLFKQHEDRLAVSRGQGSEVKVLLSPTLFLLGWSWGVLQSSTGGHSHLLAIPFSWQQLLPGSGNAASCLSLPVEVVMALHSGLSPGVHHPLISLSPAQTL